MNNNNIIKVESLKDATNLVGILLDNGYVVTCSAIWGDYPYQNRLKHVEIEYFIEGEK